VELLEPALEPGDARRRVRDRERAEPLSVIEIRRRDQTRNACRGRGDKPAQSGYDDWAKRLSGGRNKCHSRACRTGCERERRRYD
jgi:hypothetical protein